MNEAVVAAAGSGKTDMLVNRARMRPESNILILTYTNENLGQIDERLWGLPGGYPDNVTTMTLYSFLLSECVRPLQVVKTGTPNFIRSIQTERRPDHARYKGVADFHGYFLDNSRDVYSDYLSQAAVEINKASEGDVIRRIALIWDEIYIDEAQDLNGYDLELLDLLLKCPELELLLVCDPRQAVYTANAQSKHKKYRGSGFVTWIDERPYIEKSNKTSCHRSVQEICDVADSLYPDLPATQSRKSPGSRTHVGVYLVHENDIDAYRNRYLPQDLRWNRSNKKAGPKAKNMRKVKGLSFDDVLLHPTLPMSNFLEKGTKLEETSLAALYVAITRARFSVGIVTKKRSSNTAFPFWVPEDKAVQSTKSVGVLF